MEKMYRQVFVDPKDLNLQRILWIDADGRKEKHYQLLTLTYGVNCAAYLALRVLQQLAIDEGNMYPRVAEIIRRFTYVDDILYGADDIATALEVKNELVSLMAAGCFKLHKWTSSHPTVLNDLKRFFGRSTSQDTRHCLGSIE